MDDPSYWYVTQGDSVPPEFGALYVTVAVAVLLGGLFYFMFVHDED